MDMLEWPCGASFVPDGGFGRGGFSGRGDNIISLRCITGKSALPRPNTLAANPTCQRPTPICPMRRALATQN
jgi:hypothetical protein